MDNTRGIIIKILTLGAVFSLIIYFLAGLFSGVNNNGSIEDNKNNFKNINNDIIATTGVAIATSLGTRQMQIVNTPATLYQDVMTINYILANKQVAKDKIISTNMRAINEYLNIVKTDVKELLASSSDRADTLDFFIDQLKYRHNTAIDNMKSLQEQITLLKGNLTASEAEIERIKQRMEKDFENFDSGATLTNIDDYLEQREIYNYSYTYIIFINKFIKQYKFLNNTTKKIVNALETNKQALVKDVTVILPASGQGLLDDLQLLKEE
ncbi:MAG: hypothetical protein N4A38_01440 [Candidatus Gracilibacteria bacterium]|nr:hypothetical protein [Candidatus Gracilibacteria bacterium]